MHTQAHNLGAEAGFQGRTCEQYFDRPRPDPGADQGARSDCSSPAGKEPLRHRSDVLLVPDNLQSSAGSCVNRNEADLGPLAFDTKMHDTLSAVQVLHPQTTEFFT